MARFLYNLILMSISGSLMYLLGTMVSRLMKKRYSTWHYALLVSAALILVLPVQAVFTIPKIVNVEISHNVSAAVRSMDNGMTGIEPLKLLFALWLTVALIYGLFTAVSYYRSYRSIKTVSQEMFSEDILRVYNEVREQLGVNRNISVMTSEYLPSPLLFGIVKPIIVIPDREFKREELRLIFAHELIHYKHRDLIIKLIAAAAVSIHWFNPLVYLLRGSMNEGCELCCDESVLRYIALDDKKDYGRLLISIIEHSSKCRYSFTTAMASPKENIKTRLTKIAEFKRTSRIIKLVGVMAAVSMTVCSVTAFGFSSAREILPEKVSEFIEDAVTKPLVTDAPASSEEPAAVIDYPEQIQRTRESAKVNGNNDNQYSEPVQAEVGEHTQMPEPRQTEQVVETAEATAQPGAADKPHYDINNLSSADLSNESVIFSASFTEKGETIESCHIFTSETDTTMSVYSSSGSISVMDADTNEMIYDGSGSEEKTARVPVKAGQRCSLSITATEEGESEAEVYAYGSSADFTVDAEQQKVREE